MDVEPSEELWDVAAMEKSEGIGSKVIRSGIFHTAVSAGLGATCTALVVTPLDVVKTRMQSHVCAHEGGLACTDSQHFRGMGVSCLVVGYLKPWSSFSLPIGVKNDHLESGEWKR